MRRQVAPLNPGRELEPAASALMRMARTFTHVLLWLAALPCAAEPISLEADSFEHIHFRRIQPTMVSFNAGVIRFDVNKSSSFLLLPFEEVRDIRAVSFDWTANGMLNKASAAQESTRKGDDAWLRVGLIISGEPDLVPEALLPRWARQVRHTLRHPSDRMIYLIPDARHKPGETWKSPFSSNIDMVSVASLEGPDEWKQVNHTFAQPLRAVGIWLMADGDNTDSVFSSQLRNLVVE